MPVKISRTDHKFRVATPGGVKAKATTRRKAEAQRRLLEALERDPNFKPRQRRKR